MKRHRFRQSIDRAEFTSLAVCTCGWRDLTFDPVTAWAKAADHASRVHGDAERALQGLRAARASRARTIEKEYA